MIRQPGAPSPVRKSYVGVKRRTLRPLRGQVVVAPLNGEARDAGAVRRAGCGVLPNSLDGAVVQDRTTPGGIALVFAKQLKPKRKLPRRRWGGEFEDEVAAAAGVHVAAKRDVEGWRSSDRNT